MIEPTGSRARIASAADPAVKPPPARRYLTCVCSMAFRQVHGNPPTPNQYSYETCRRKVRRQILAALLGRMLLTAAIIGLCAGVTAIKQFSDQDWALDISSALINNPSG